ncbi:MAG: hypothetical protein M1813_003269 [Trichoglossum hirsutum]|nr:MAG: hypothetical protein M1813_003269 [Trichoglossum hirsutum]
MSDSAKITEFPAIKSKLAAPTKKSIFERQKAEAEAKRRREEAETAAVYEDFVKSFEDDDGGASASHVRNTTGGSGFGASAVIGGAPRRHFTVPTGPAGSRGGVGHAGRGGFGPLGHDAVTGPPSRKRTHDGLQSRPRDNDQGLFAFEDSLSGPTATAFQTSDDEDNAAADGRTAEHVTPKPTLQLSSLPPGTSPAVIKSLLPPILKVDAVRLIPPSGPTSTERKTLSAIVTLAKDTPANDIDTAVNGLQNRYLGWGYYLSLARHLSSAALCAAPQISGGAASALTSLPFGAKPLSTGPGSSLNRAPPPHRGGFAPPASFTPTGPGQFGRTPPLQVLVNPPSNLKQLKMIHKTIENLIRHGPEFEALLMSRLEVQREQKWAWIWDARSPGGVWYRWRLWEILSGSQEGSGYGRSASNSLPQYVFDGGASWMAPKRGLRFEYVTKLDEFISDDDYDSSEDENSDDEDMRRHHQNRYGGPPQDSDLGAADDNGKAYLNPLQRSKLAHLLARLPTSTAKLRKGDVARVTCFAIEHAGEGADEVVDMIVSNIEQPFTYTSANPDRRANEENEDEDDGEGAKDRSKEKEDNSSSKLIALYVVSDILSSSSTSGVRHAWRYRQLFETALRKKAIFEGLGRLDKELQWGRLRAEKWKRSVQSVLTLWEGWCVFPQPTQEHFSAVFASPPPTAAEKAAAAAASSQSSSGPGGASSALKSRWKTVDATATPEAAESPRVDLDATLAIDSQKVVDESPGGDGDVDGEPMLEDEDEDVDGVPMEDDEEGGSINADREPTEKGLQQTIGHTSGAEPKVEVSPVETTAGSITTGIGFRAKGTKITKGLSDGTPVLGKRRRPKAEDMFADSDDDL